MLPVTDLVSNFGALDWVIVAVYLGASIAVGILANRYIFWTIVYLIGLVSFYILLLAIIPLGARDLRALLRELRKDRP